MEEEKSEDAKSLPVSCWEEYESENLAEGGGGPVDLEMSRHRDNSSERKKIHDNVGRVRAR